MPHIAEMDVYEFAAALILTEDLDPVYCTLSRAMLPPAQLDRFLFAYMCFYNMGVAAFMSEHDDSTYWHHMKIAAANIAPTPMGARWPRSPERRHFRGDKCIKAIDWFSTAPASHWVGEIEICTSLSSVNKVIEAWPMFSTWAAFKFADLLETVKGAYINIPDDIALLYKEPRAGLDMLVGDTGMTREDTLSDLKLYMSYYWEPASGHRRCNIQEVETVLCKNFSYRKGHYNVGKDIKEIRHALGGWGDTAAHLLSCAPIYKGDGYDRSDRTPIGTELS